MLAGLIPGQSFCIEFSYFTLAVGLNVSMNAPHPR